MSTNATITTAGKTYPVLAAAQIPAGRWDVRATIPGSSWVWLTVRRNGAVTPLVPGEADGTVSLDVPVGDILIQYNGAAGTGGTQRVVVRAVAAAPQPVRSRATIGIITQHHFAKRIEADRRLTQKVPALRFVTSDFNAATGKLAMQPANTATERGEIAWLRAANPNAYVVACAMNLWGKPGERSYATITREDARAWAWLALDTWGGDVDCILGPNEADSWKYNGHIRRDNSNRDDAIRHLHELWAEAAAIFMAAGIPTGGPAHIRPDSMRMWEREYGSLTNVVTCHPYMDRRVAFAQEMRALADAKNGFVVIDEIAPAAVNVGGKLDQAKTDAAAARLLTDWAPHCDVITYYCGRSEPTEGVWDFAAALDPDGTERPLLAALQPIFNASPRRARTQIDQYALQVYAAIAEARRAEGLRALRPSARLVAQARRTAQEVARQGATAQLSADFLRTSSATAIAPGDSQSIGGVSIATRLTPSVVREEAAGWRTSPSHRPLLLSEAASEVGVAVVIGTSRYGTASIPTAYFWACVA